MRLRASSILLWLRPLSGYRQRSSRVRCPPGERWRQPSSNGRNGESDSWKHSLDKGIEQSVSKAERPVSDHIDTDERDAETDVCIAAGLRGTQKAVFPLVGYHE